MDTERKHTPPDAVNDEQEDESAQTQQVAAEALGRESNAFGLGDTEKVGTGDETDDVQDLVDHMVQMERSGRLDFDAYRGERSDDDEDGMLGDAAEE